MWGKPSFPSHMAQKAPELSQIPHTLQPQAQHWPEGAHSHLMTNSRCPAAASECPGALRTTASAPACAASHPGWGSHLRLPSTFPERVSVFLEPDTRMVMKMERNLAPLYFVFPIGVHTPQRRGGTWTQISTVSLGFLYGTCYSTE